MLVRGRDRASATAMAAGFTIQSNDAAKGRGFAVRLPDNYDSSKPYWLIFGFHWRGGTADQVDNGGGNGDWWSYYGMQRESKNNAIFVAPQGNGGGWSDPSDLTFVDDMVKVIEDNLLCRYNRIWSPWDSVGAPA